MRKLLLALLATGVMLCVSGTVWAQCPAFANNISGACNETFTINSNGTVTASAVNGTFDGDDDVMVGVINNDTVSVGQITVTGSGIADFDGDGPWAAGLSCLTNPVAGALGCLTPSQGGNGAVGSGGGNDPFDYSGGTTSNACGVGCYNVFSNYLSGNSVQVNFSKPLAANGGTSYFGLELPANAGSGGGFGVTVTPEPASMALFATLLGLSGLGLLRKRCF
jgi:hypothetical protein